MNEEIKNGIIILWLFIALYEAFRVRSILSIIIILFILFRHFQHKHTKYANNRLIKLGSFVLAIEGFRLRSLMISFTGTYSFVSKYGEYSDNREEIRLLASVIVWVIIWSITCKHK